MLVPCCSLLKDQLWVVYTWYWFQKQTPIKVVAEGVFRLDKISVFLVVLKIQVKWTVGVSSVVVIDSVVEKGLVEELDRAIFGRGWFDSKLKFEVFFYQSSTQQTISYSMISDLLIWHTRWSHHLSYKFRSRELRERKSYSCSWSVILEAMFLKATEVPEIRLQRTPFKLSRGSLQT